MEIIREIFLSLGSNQGDRHKMLEMAVKSIEQETGTLLKRSSVYETEPWEMPGADPFLNQVIQISTSLSPPDLLKTLQKIEKKLGRIHHPASGISHPASPAFFPRPIDIDILFYSNQIIDLPELVIPHQKIPERRFVLVPLAEIAADFIHPALKLSIRKLLEQCQDRLKVKLFVDRRET